MDAMFRVEVLEAQPPLTHRVRLWRDGREDHSARFATLLQEIAPSTPGVVTLGGRARPEAERTTTAQLPELLRRHSNQNIQIAWRDQAGLVLDVICELYDDHIELAARGSSAERLVALIEEGAA